MTNDNDRDAQYDAAAALVKKDFNDEEARRDRALLDLAYGHGYLPRRDANRELASDLPPVRRVKPTTKTRRTLAILEEIAPQQKMERCAINALLAERDAEKGTHR